jgi:hypothetical protein
MERSDFIQSGIALALILPSAQASTGASYCCITNPAGTPDNPGENKPFA